MKSVLTVVVLVFVPILGLISCSQDRHTDDWQMAQPTVEAPGQPVLTLNAASRRTLAGDSALKFSGSPWQAMRVKSTCHFGDAFETSEANLSSRETLTLKELWPVHFLKSLSLSELAQTECDFAFMASNAHGSTQAFELDHIKLTAFSDHDMSSRVATALATPEALLSPAVRSLSNDFDDDAELILACGKSTSSLSNRAAARSPDIMQALTLQMGLHGHQICHFAAVESEADGRTRSHMTDDLTVNFPSVFLTVSSSNPIESLVPSFGTPSTPPILRVNVSNPGEATVFLKLAVPHGIHLRLVYHGSFKFGEAASFHEPTTTIDSAVTIAVSGAAESMAATDGSRMFELQPHQTLTADLALSGHNHLGGCMTLTGSSEPSPAGYVGFRYALDEPFVISETDSPQGLEATAIFNLAASRSEAMNSSVVFSAKSSEVGSNLNALGPVQRDPATGGCFGGSL